MKQKENDCENKSDNKADMIVYDTYNGQGLPGKDILALMCFIVSDMTFTSS